MNRRKFLTGLTALPVAVCCAPLTALAVRTKDCDGTFIGVVGDAPLMTEMLPSMFAYKPLPPTTLSLAEFADMVRQCGGGCVAEHSYGATVWLNDYSRAPLLRNALWHRKSVAVYIEILGAEPPIRYQEEVFQKTASGWMRMNLGHGLVWPRVESYSEPPWVLEGGYYGSQKFS